MKALKIFLYVCLFFLTGELLIRIDLKYDLLNNAAKRIEVKMKESDLRNEINQGKFVTKPNQIRILIIGDSYIYGGGIAPSDKFSERLSLLLKKSNPSEKEILILDASKPSNNTLDNYNSFLYYENKFKPHFIFWAYNFNDILGMLQQAATPSKKMKSPPQSISKKRTGLKNIVKQFYSFSSLARYISENIQKQLKYMGIVLPIGDFYYLTKEAYLDKNKNWINTQKILNEVSQICSKNQSIFILYRMPDFNLLNHPDLFSVFDNAMKKYANSDENIVYFNGIEDFQNKDGNTFKLSKYDGHPNEQAHMIIAEKIALFINKKIEQVRMQ